MRILAITAAWMAGLLACTPAQAASVASSRHNLSATGPGSVRAAAETAVCDFCHTPHRAAPATALWNRRNPGTTYAPYTSSTALAAPGQPNGSSLLCLSCHDGTVALGDVLDRSAPIAMAGGVSSMPPGRGLTGTDLRHHHPISFVFDSNLAGRKGELTMPSALPREIRLDRAGQMQCTSCHDPHDDSYGQFLVMPNTNSRLCVECHRKEGWSTSPHAQSSASWNGQGRSPWPGSNDRTVASNACRNCHETHQTGGGANLLRHAVEEDNCADCHNGNVATHDVMSTMNRVSAHAVGTATGAHEPGEPAVVGTRHVECADCHDAHTGPAMGPGLRVRGVNLASSEVRRATRNYEVCLRCHGDSPDKGTPRVRRQLDQNNVRLEIQQGNPSSHPIAGPGRNPDVPSLIAPWTTQSTMDCIDCHNSDAAASIGGSGPDGPHGSMIAPILSRNYVTTDNAPESASNYALCYGCHSRDSILNDESFRGHREHVSDQRTPCSVCHDPHGVSATQGNGVNNTSLINFDTTVVTPNAQGALRYVDQGRYRGTCDLACHGKDHQSEGY